MDGHLTITQIQNDVLFLHGDIDELEERLTSIFARLDSRILEAELSAGEAEGIESEKHQAFAVGTELLAGLRILEERLSGGYLKPRLSSESRELPNQRSRRLLAEAEESFTDAEQLSVG